MARPSLGAACSLKSPYVRASELLAEHCLSQRPVINEESLGARGRNRTGTILSNLGILSPVRLPVSPPGHTYAEAARSHDTGSGHSRRKHCSMIVRVDGIPETHRQKRGRLQ